MFFFKKKTIYQAIKLYVHLIKLALSRNIIISKQISRKYIYRINRNYNIEYT